MLSKYCCKCLRYGVALWRRLPATLRQLLPTIILIAIAALAGATNVFSAQVHHFVADVIHERFHDVAPYLTNVILAAILFNVAYLLYGPLNRATDKVLQQINPEKRIRSFVTQATKLLYWLATVFIVVSLFAPDLMGKLFTGASFITAAVVFALQGAAQDFVFGLTMQVTHRFQVGDFISTESSLSDGGIQGTVTEIGYMLTKIDTGDNEQTISNSKLWSAVITRRKNKAPSAE